jgi:hypothetical protein
MECLTCADNFYSFGFECVVTCPTYPVLYFSHIQSASCFAICPAPYFGEKSSQQC